jgi:predicted aminopeptidase
MQAHHRRQRLEPLGAQFLFDGNTDEALTLLCGKGHGCRGFPGLAQIVRLGVGTIFESRSAARVGLAGYEQRAEALGSAPGVGLFEKLKKGCRLQFQGPVDQGVMTRRQNREFRVLLRNAQARRKRFDQRHARFLMAVMGRPQFARCRCFAQVMDQNREARGRRRIQAHGAFERHHDVNAGVDFRMPARGLRHAVERCDLGKDHLERTALAQGEKEELGVRLAQGPLSLLPDPLGYQRIDFAIPDHFLHQGARLRRNREPTIAEAGREACYPQHADRVFDESFRDVAQDTSLQIIGATKRIDEFAGRTLRDGIDRQIAPAQILRERHVGGEAHSEPAIARRDLGFQARERVFLFSLGMQEDRELASHRKVPESLEILRARADDHPVTLARGNPEELIPNCAADQVDLHARMLTESFAAAPTASDAPPTRSTFAARAVFACIAILMLPACGTMYLAQAARGQWQMVHARRPIAAVMGDPKTSPALRARLTEVRDARAFASQQLGLPDNKSYRSYADLKRSFVTWNIVAAPEFSVVPMQWCFPIAGCVAYRGYFSDRRAESFANSLRRRGFDVVVEGSAAYSTLGHFADPVLNTMLIYGDSELAAIIFHELAHQLIYVEDDSEFDEAFAVTVEETGLARWLAYTGRTQALDEYHRERIRERAFNTLFAQRRAELARLYASKLAPEVLRERKRVQYEALAEDMRDLARRQGVRLAYEDWIDAGLNNAHLASVATYFECVPGFERLLAQQNGDLPRFYAAVRALAHAPRRERHQALCTGSAQRNQQARLAAPHLDYE